MITGDPYPNGQGEGLDTAARPLVAYESIDFAEVWDRGLIPWPPWVPVEAPPCCWILDTDFYCPTHGSERRRLWCDRPAGHETDTAHRAITDLAKGKCVEFFTGPRSKTP